MAFRLGHQISCNTNKNFFFRNSSVTARRYNRSLSRGTEKPDNLAENAQQNHETETTASNSNSRPRGSLFWGTSTSNNVENNSNSGKPWKSRIQARDYNTELERKIAKQTQNLRSAFRRAGNNNYALQPKNLPPMATTHIPVSNKFATLEEIPNRPYGIRLDELQRQAYVKYEKAVRTLGLKRATESRTYRYQLEAAKMSKRTDIYDIVAEIKNREQTKVAMAPQLQPKNIKPYGDIIPVSWSTPGIERLKQKPLSISRLGEVIKNNHTQVRNFSTMHTRNQCLETNKNFFRSVLSKNLSDQGRTITNSKEFDEPKGAAHQPEDDTSDYDYEYNPAKQPKLQIPDGFIDGKVVLYYSNKKGAGKGTICSKVLPKNDQKVDIPQASQNQFKAVSEVKTDLTKYRRAVITRAGPKVMLQSRELDDNENSECISPGSFEKFTVPWMSWGERVKLKMQESIEGKMQNEMAEPEEKSVSYKKTKSAPILGGKDRRADIQIRDFSTFSVPENHEKSIHSRSDLEELDQELTFSLPTHEDFYDDVDWPDVSPISKTGGKLLHTSTRMYATKCRGVLEPEGTVMVKLHRLPKINIPEPEKVCVEEVCPNFIRADAGLKVIRRNLPPLKPKPCAKTCTEPCMLEGEPLVRPKKRPIPIIKRAPGPCVKDTCPDRADAGMKILPKKLPKLIPKPCGRCEDIEMTSPPLVRLKPRPIPPPKECKIVGPCGCDPPVRADANLKVVRKKLPSLVPPDCPRLCPPEMIGGPPLIRPKAMHVPIVKKCSEVCPCIDPCPPRADHVSGYKVVKRQLPTILLAEKNNEMSIQEYAMAQMEKQKRYFSSYSKCDMCCFSNRKLQPDLKTIQSEICPTQWEEFKGLLKAGDDGKLEVYDTATETVDTSTGSELRITKKPIGGLKKRDDDIPQRLLKGGYSIFYDGAGTRKYSVSATALLPQRKCDFEEPPLPNPDTFTFPKLKRLQKRRGFDVDFPDDSVPWKMKNNDCMKKFLKENEKPAPRMDDILNYEVTSKTLPVIPRGICKKLPVRPPGAQIALTPPKKLYEPVEERVECKPVTVYCARADDTLVEEAKKLPPPPISECEQVKPMPYKQLKKLPRLKFDDADPPRICHVPVTPCQINRRADEGIDFAPRKTLPTLKPTNCPRTKVFKMADLRPLKRLPPHPFMERIPCIPEPSFCDEPRADELANYEVVPKVLPPLLKNDGKRLNLFPPIPCPIDTKRRRMSTYCDSYSCKVPWPSRRFLSTTSIFRAKDCKIKKDTNEKKKCYKTQVSPCKPIPTAKSCVCPQAAPYPPCTKQNSPYPSFSECKDDDPYLGITECGKNDKHLQPKYPIVGEFLILKPPPPNQGQIDTQLEEDCIFKKLNLKREGGTTKTCSDFHKTVEPLRAREVLKDAMKQTGGCVTDDTRCELGEKQRPPMQCDKQNEKQEPPKIEPGKVKCSGPPPRAGKAKLNVKPCAKYDPKRSPPKKTICEKKPVDCPDPCEDDPKKKPDGPKGSVGKGGGKGGARGISGGPQCRSVASCGTTNATTSLPQVTGQKPYCKLTTVNMSNNQNEDDCGPEEKADPCGGKSKAKKADPCGGQAKAKKADPCGGKAKKSEAKKASSCGGKAKKAETRNADPCGGKAKTAEAKKDDPCGSQAKAKSADPCGDQVKAKESSDPCGGESKAKTSDPCGGETKAKASARESPRAQKESKPSGDACGSKKAKQAADTGKKCQPIKFDCPKPKEAKKAASKCNESAPKAETSDIKIKCAKKKKAAQPKSPLAIKCRPVKKPPPPKPKMKCLPKVPPVAPRKRSLWDRILDFFRARPGCPPPDQWKKDKLKRDAERAAAAAGYELCEKKKPKSRCTFPPPSKGDKKPTSKCGMKVKPCGKNKGPQACKPKPVNQTSKCAQKVKPCQPKKIAAKAGNSRCMSSHRKSSCKMTTPSAVMPKGVDPRQKYPSSVELPYTNFPESTENFPKMPMSESMFAKIKTDMEPKQTRPYSTICRWKRLNHNAMIAALGQKLNFSTTPNQFGLYGAFSFKHLSVDKMNDTDLNRTTLKSQVDVHNQSISNIFALPVTPSSLYMCPVLKDSNCALGLSTSSISQYLQRTGLFKRHMPELSIALLQQVRHYSSPKDCKIKGTMEEKKKCKQFGQQPCCEEKSRDVCDGTAVYPPCTPIEAPYPSFSECYNKFKRMAIAECTEQLKRHNKQKISGETSVTQIQAKAKKNRNKREYSTMSCQRYFSSCPKNGNSYPMLLPELSEETLRDMEEKELAKKVLHTVKSGMEAIAISGSDVEAQEAYYQLYEELEKLCENDLNLNKGMNVCEDMDLQPICSRDFFPDTALVGNNMPLYADDSLHQLMTIDAIKSFCFSIPPMPTTLYEESEQYKTEKLQKQLDELLDYYKAQKI